MKLFALEDMPCGFQCHLLYDIRPCEYKSNTILCFIASDSSQELTFTENKPTLLQHPSLLLCQTHFPPP